MSTAGSLLRGSIFRTLDLFFVVAASFWVTPYLVHSLGARIYGFWTLVVAFVGYYGLLDLGLSSAAARYMSQALGKGDQAELDRVASTAFFLFCGVALAVTGAAGLSAWACPLFLKDPAEAEVFRQLILVMGAAAAALFVSKVFMGMLMADIRYDVIAVISIARTLLCNGAIVLALVRGYGARSVALVSLAAAVAQSAALYGAFKTRFPSVRISPRLFETSRIRLMLGYGSSTVVSQLGDVMRFRLDTVLIAWFLNAALVTPYAVGSRLVEGFARFVLSSAGMMLPVFSQYQGRGDYPAIRVALLKVTKIATILSVFVGASIIYYGRAFIRRWMGEGFGSAYLVAAILCAGFIIELPQSPGVQMLYGISKHRFYAVLSVWEGLANVALSILFLKRWGIYGVALGTTVEFAIVKLFIQPVYICRFVDLPVRTYLIDTILMTAVKTGLPLAVFFMAARGFVAPSYGSLAACVAVQTALFLPLAYFFLMEPAERQAALGMLGVGPA